MKNIFKISFLCSFFVGLLIAFILPSSARAQKKIEYGYYAAPEKTGKEIKAVDLTKEVLKKCIGSLKKQVGSSFIELKFSPEFTDEARNIFTALENSVHQTQKVLFPLPIENVRFYLLQMDEIPASYKIIDSVTDREFYLHLWIFKDKKTLDLSCNKEDKLCGSIYQTIPHELTHVAIENLIDHKDVSWFEEGLCNYVGKEVNRTYRMPAISDNFDENVPRVTLHRQDIQNDLFFWNHSSNNKKINFVRNEWFRYIAAEELIQLIIENAKKQGIEKPLNLLLTKLKERKEKLGKPADSYEITALIQESLNVNPKTLGILDEQTQKNFVNEALNLLSQSEIGIEKKNYALYVLAGIDDIEISDRWIKYLLEEVYRQKNGDQYQQELAATALARRFKQTDFDKILETFLLENKKLVKDSPKKVKRELQELSIRPPVK